MYVCMNIEIYLKGLSIVRNDIFEALKESLNSNSQQFHQYQQNKQSPPHLTTLIAYFEYFCAMP